MKFSRSAAALLGVLLSATVSASDHSHESGHRQAGGHVHGLGQLNFAVEKNKVFLELNLPVHDLLGFVNIRTPSQKEQAEQAEARVMAASTWYFSPVAQCRQLSAGILDDHDEQADHHGDKHHDEHAEHHGDKHRDFRFQLVYRCQHIDKLKMMGTHLFEYFPHTQKLQLQGLLPAGRQLSAELSRKQQKVQF